MAGQIRERVGSIVNNLIGRPQKEPAAPKDTAIQTHSFAEFITTVKEGRVYVLPQETEAMSSDGIVGTQRSILYRTVVDTRTQALFVDPLPEGTSADVALATAVDRASMLKELTNRKLWGYVSSGDAKHSLIEQARLAKLNDSGAKPLPRPEIQF